MTNHASGTFEVKLVPQVPEDDVGDPCIGRMSLKKEFRGDLQAVSKGQMLALRTGVDGSAGYVAIEWVTGSLGGREGGFGLQHYGIMRRGVPELILTVIPDSGTGELVGLDGKMRIVVANGAHSYEFDYDIGSPPEH